MSPNLFTQIEIRQMEENKQNKHAFQNLIFQTNYTTLKYTNKLPSKMIEAKSSERQLQEFIQDFNTTDIKLSVVHKHACRCCLNE